MVITSITPTPLVSLGLALPAFVASLLAEAVCSSAMHAGSRAGAGAAAGVSKLYGHFTVQTYRSAYGIFCVSGILFNHESPRRGTTFVSRKITMGIASILKVSLSTSYLFKSCSCVFAGTYLRFLLAEVGVAGLQFRLALPHSICIWCPHRHRVSREGNKGTLEKAWCNSFFVLLQGERLCLELGNLDARRDWGHSRDYVKSMWLMLQQKVPKDYVVATGKRYSTTLHPLG